MKYRTSKEIAISLVKERGVDGLDASELIQVGIWHPDDDVRGAAEQKLGRSDDVDADACAMVRAREKYRAERAMRKEAEDKAAAACRSEAMAWRLLADVTSRWEEQCQRDQPAASAAAAAAEREG